MWKRIGDLVEASNASLLGCIRSCLGRIPDIEVVLEIGSNRLAGQGQGHAQYVNIYIAPVRAITLGPELDAFALAVLPYSPTAVDLSRPNSLSSIDHRIPVLHFDERIGECRRRVEVTLTEPGAVPRPIDETLKLERRTWVRVFPDVATAQQAAEEAEAERAVLRERGD